MKDFTRFGPLISLFLWVILGNKDGEIFTFETRTEPLSILIFADLSDFELFCEFGRA